MKKLLPREELVFLVQKIMNCEFQTEEEDDLLIEQVINGVIDPEISDYIFWSDEEMTAEQIVDKALSYKPIIL